MITILLGAVVFATCMLLLGLGLLLRDRPLTGGCHAACALSGRCPQPADAVCRSRKGAPP